MKKPIYFVSGISFDKIITNINTIENEFDEYDKYGNKTGKKFKELHTFIDIPNKKNIKILTKNYEQEKNLVYDFSNLSFRDGKYIGNLNSSLKIFETNMYDHNLSKKIVGLTILEIFDDEFNISIDENHANNVIENSKKQLAELFGYIGPIKLYLTTHYTSFK